MAVLVTVPTRVFLNPLLLGSVVIVALPRRLLLLFALGHFGLAQDG
jgi:hypothetical protein